MQHLNDMIDDRIFDPSMTDYLTSLFLREPAVSLSAKDLNSFDNSRLCCLCLTCGRVYERMSWMVNLTWWTMWWLRLQPASASLLLIERKRQLTCSQHSMNNCLLPIDERITDTTGLVERFLCMTTWNDFFTNELLACPAWSSKENFVESLCMLLIVVLAKRQKATCLCVLRCTTMNVISCGQAVRHGVLGDDCFGCSNE